MRHIGEDLFDPTLKDIIAEAKRNLAALHPDALPAALARAEALPQADFDGKQCAICQRRFHVAAEYLACKACPALACRKGDCKNLHQAHHRVALLRQRATEKV